MVVPVLAPNPPPSPPPSPPNIPPPPAVAACVFGADAEVLVAPSPKPPNDNPGAEVVAAGAVPNRGAEVVAEEVTFVFRLPKRDGLLFEPAFALEVSRLREKGLL